MSVDSRPVSSRVLFGVFTFLLGLAVLFALTFPPGAMAWIIDPPTSPVFNVDNNSDNPVLNKCTDADPEDCSLRGALLVINTYPDLFPLYTINIPSGLGPNEPVGSILLTNGQLEIFTNVQIVGPGADQLTINAQNNSRVFYVYAAQLTELGILNGIGHGNAAISGMTITNGNGSPFGGGIYVEGGQATLTNCVVTSNSAVKGGGAAVDTNGSLTISGGVVSYNSACLEGGGIYAGGAPDTLTLTNAAIMNNTAGWSGGGVFVRDSTANLTGCTITDNEAMYSGGGVTAYYGTANIVNCTITGNKVTGEMAAGGGGIRVYYGTLTLQDSTLSGNTSTDDGGGISLYGVPGLDGITTALKENTALEDAVPKTLTLTNTTIMNNTALGYGGGVYASESTADLTDSTVKNNQADVGGGGVAVQGEFNLVNINRSTISGNQVLCLEVVKGGLVAKTTDGCWVDGGGGIFFDDYGEGTVNILNSTISGNSSLRHGGGILYYGSTGVTLNISHSTIVHNLADLDESNDGYGGGIYTSGGLTNLRNTIIADNLGYSTLDDDDLYGTFNSLGYNLVLSPGTATINIEDTDITGVDPLLGELANNGGPTQTHALLTGSPALNAGVCTGIDEADVLTDQRGVARPQQSACDIGAFELGFYDLTVQKTGTGTGTVTSNPAGINCGDDCTETYVEPTVVTLTAAAGADSVFAGWTGGGCTGAGDCVVTMDAAKNVTAQFDLAGQTYTLTVQIAGTGTGIVTSNPAGIVCPGDCAEVYDAGQTVTLTPAADPGNAFESWNGGGCGGNGPCNVTMTQDFTVIATFGPDIDNDGITDNMENNGPNNGDANKDGIPDFQQSNVATFLNIYGEWVTLIMPSWTLNPNTTGAHESYNWYTQVANGGNLSGVTATGNPSPGDSPAGVNFGVGFYDFTIINIDPGEVFVVPLILHKVDNNLSTYYKYGPTPDNPAPHWYEFLYDGQTGAEIFVSNGWTVILLHFIDGQRGDDDLTVNGVVVDIGGPAQPAAGPSPAAAGGGGSASCFIDALR